MLRSVLFVCGIISLILAFIGIFLPLLPTVPLIILAAACFARSSVVLHRWLINNKYFGPIIKAWEESKSISLSAKIISIVVLNFSIMISIILVKAYLWAVIVLIGVNIGVSLYIIRIPTTGPDNKKFPKN